MPDSDQMQFITQEELPHFLASRIQAARKQKGLSQKALAAQLHVSRQTISNWENERSRPDFEAIAALNDLLDLNLSVLEQPAAPSRNNPPKPARRRRRRRKSMRYRLACMILIKRRKALSVRRILEKREE